MIGALELVGGSTNELPESEVSALQEIFGGPEKEEDPGTDIAEAQGKNKHGLSESEMAALGSILDGSPEKQGEEAVKAKDPKRVLVRDQEGKLRRGVVMSVAKEQVIVECDGNRNSVSLASVIPETACGDLVDRLLAGEAVEMLIDEGLKRTDKTRKQLREEKSDVGTPDDSA